MLSQGTGAWDANTVASMRSIMGTTTDRELRGFPTPHYESHFPKLFRH
jgi:hypothetical protein